MCELLKKLLDLRRNDRGSVIILTTLSSVALLGFVAMAADAGMMYETRRELQNAIDGAALAGAWELPGDPVTALAKARQYASLNGVISSEITALNIASLYNPNDAVEITVQRNVELGFARVLGFNSANVEAKATGLVAQVQPKGLLPIGLPVSALNQGGYSVLKFGAPGGGSPGNFRPLDYPPLGGSSDYLTDLENGWDNLSVMPNYDPPNAFSWWVDTQTGNMAGPTKRGIDYLENMSAQYDQSAWILSDPQSYDPNNPPPGFKPSIEGYRIGLVPLISDSSWAAATGNSNPIEIVGFATFYVVGYTNGPTGQLQIEGIFLNNAKSVGKAIIGAPLQGLIGARLYR